MHRIADFSAGSAIRGRDLETFPPTGRRVGLSSSVAMVENLPRHRQDRRAGTNVRKAWLRKGRNWLSSGNRVCLWHSPKGKRETTVKITEQFINKGRTKKGNLTPGQRRILTGQWNPIQGWEKRIIGRAISSEAARLFLTTFKRQQIHARPSLSSGRRYDSIRQFGARRTKGMCK